MKRRNLLRHLGQHGCYLLREGGRHSYFHNPANGKTSAVPRHRKSMIILLGESAATWKFPNHKKKGTTVVVPLAEHE